MRLEFLCDLNLTAGQRMIVGKDIRGGKGGSLDQNESWEAEE